MSSHHKNIQRALRSLEVNHFAVWKDCLVIAVTSNNYSLNDQIRVLLLLKQGDFKRLIEWADTLSTEVWDNADEHFRMVQLSSLIRKYPLEAELTGLDPEETAKRKFREAELRCRRYNRYFRLQRTITERFPSLKHQMRSYIAYVLGEAVDHTMIGGADSDIFPLWTKMMDLCDYGEGANIGVHGDATNIGAKLCAESWTVGPLALPFVKSALLRHQQILETFLPQREDGMLCYDITAACKSIDERLQMVRYNKISFVPKTAKTHRAIAVEPLLNSFLQKGVDAFMRSRLKRVGVVDLSDQKLNQLLAKQGSLGGDDPYVTIDLSSASDNISLEVVKSLLPPRWFDLMNSLRSVAYSLDGDVRTFEKFVSMGNGFCFPLQTLIFSSVCHAAALELGATPDFRVYGDDIIVRQSVAGRVLELLRHFGFQPNPDKTFLEGPFRESCGADWFGGENVRPVEIKKRLDSLPRLFSLHNESLRRNSRVREYFAEIREYLQTIVPKIVRFVSAHDPAEPDLSSLPTEVGHDTVDGAFWVTHDVYIQSALVRWFPEEQRFQSYVMRSQPCTDRNPYPPLVQWVGVLRGTRVRYYTLNNGEQRLVPPFTLRYRSVMKPRLI